jgi:hypothetical protein
MPLINLTFIDEIERLPIRSYTLECSDDIEVEDVMGRMNGQKWKYNADIRTIKKGVRPLNECNVVSVKSVVSGGWSGGPLGLRKYTFPSIFEDPADYKITPDVNKIKCFQEGSHLMCSLEPGQMP